MSPVRRGASGGDGPGGTAPPGGRGGPAEEAGARELSPRGAGGVSVLEVRGRAALARLAALAGRLPAEGEVALARIRDGDEVLDEGIVLRTGDARAELHVTGSPPLVRRLLALFAASAPESPEPPEEPEALPAASRPRPGGPGRAGDLPAPSAATSAGRGGPGDGPRAATPSESPGALRGGRGGERAADRAAERAAERAGERAGEHADAGEGASAEGAVAPVEERAWRALAAAPGEASEAGARILLDQARGALRRALEGAVAAPAGEWRSLLAELARAGRAAEAALHPVEVVIAGPTNAGKSTLFNALVADERVIVSEEPGTTRDAVVAEAVLGAYPVRLVDTAGEREVPEGPAVGVERAGQARGRERRGRARVVLWLEPADGTDREGPGPRGEPAAGDPGAGGAGARVVRLTSRADLAPVPPAGDAIGARDDPEGARRLVARLFRAALALPEEPWRPGAPVPFDADLRRALAGLGDLAEAERARELARILGSPAAPR